MADEDTTSEDPSNTDIDALTTALDPDDDVFNLIQAYADPEAGESDKPTYGDQQ